MIESKFQIGTMVDEENYPNRDEQLKFVEKILHLVGHHHSLKVLEVGTNEGFVSEVLRKSRPSWKITRSDLSNSAEFKEQWFDVVVSSLSFHKFATRDELLLRIKRVLAPGGTLLIQDFHKLTGLTVFFHFIRNCFLFRSVKKAKAELKKWEELPPSEEMSRLITSSKFGTINYSQQINGFITETMATASDKPNVAPNH